MNKKFLIISMGVVVVICAALVWVNKTYFSDSPTRLGNRCSTSSFENNGEKLSFSKFNGVMTLKSLNATKGATINLTCNSKVAKGDAKIYLLDSNDSVVWQSNINGTSKKQINVSKTQKYLLRLCGSAKNGSEVINIKPSKDVTVEDKGIYDN